MFDNTSFWVFVKKHDRRIMATIFTAVVFMIGWHTGRIMSPYYSSQPIVFQDRQCSACSTSTGGTAELQTLRDEGVALKEGKTPSVAGSTAGTEGQQFVASVNSDLFHHVSCGSVSRIKEANKVWYASAEEAKAAGRKASSCAAELGY